MPPRPADGLPAAAFSGDAALFARYLEDTGQDYLLLEQADDQRARLRFCGAFLGQVVVWNCEFLTLAAEQVDWQKRHTGAQTVLRNFIEVGEAGPQGVPLRVGLAVVRIDQPAIEKMIIMIRNYKRLQLGRHEYGQAERVLNPGA